MSRVVSDGEVWADLAARIAGSTRAHDGVEPDVFEVDVLTAQTAQHLGVDRDRVRDVYLARLVMFGG